MLLSLPSTIVARLLVVLIILATTSVYVHQGIYMDQGDINKPTYIYEEQLEHAGTIDK